MKRIRCPKCQKPVLKTIGVNLRGPAWYYIDRQKFGYIYFHYWSSILKKEAKKNVLSFYCRHCQKEFPQEMNKKIYHWIKLKGILNKLTKS